MLSHPEELDSHVPTLPFILNSAEFHLSTLLVTVGTAPRGTESQGLGEALPSHGGSHKSL